MEEATERERERGRVRARENGHPHADPPSRRTCTALHVRRGTRLDSRGRTRTVSRHANGLDCHQRTRTHASPATGRRPCLWRIATRASKAAGPEGFNVSTCF